MVKIVVIMKDKTVNTLNVNQFDEDKLYRKCKFRSAENFEKRTTWTLNNDTNVSLYAKDTGRHNTTNQYDFPPPVDNELYYGNVALCAHSGITLTKDSIVDFTSEQWEKLYEKLFGGFEDLGTDDSYSEEEEIDPEIGTTKEGYSKEDNFIVSDGSCDVDGEYIEEEESVKNSDNEDNDNEDNDNEDNDEEDNNEEDSDNEEKKDSDEDTSEWETSDEDEGNSELEEDEYEYE